MAVVVVTAWKCMIEQGKRERMMMIVFWCCGLVWRSADDGFFVSL
jgi:hypothetical protein